ncbi:archaeal heat shock protein Hsp20 [Candidatus Nitrosotenuis chungbukensis]|uniref:archaeal heat shock protein Hsp20 n=1 Tax=Candidatus Nitrosotenuis chungbukensis TaxID=1353246 RepID=UPI0005B2B5DE|nr:archaeal heat shock protein Hsp20 [Candidatus Nitrosotenuis chungbukensis]
MTVLFDDEFDRIFKKMSSSFMDLDNVFEESGKSGSTTFGPFYYGYSMTVGQDGKPVIKEYGNVKPGLLPSSESREPLIDAIIDEKEKTLKLIAEMPGVEKKDISVVVEGKTVHIDAEHGEKKYHGNAPIRHEVDEDSVKATYTNGILEMVFKLKEQKPKGKTVEVN